MSDTERWARETIQRGLASLEPPQRNVAGTRALGTRRRRRARLGTVVLATFAALAIVVPLGAMSGLLDKTIRREGPWPRAVPLASCSDREISLPPTIDCQAAVSQAWKAAAFLETASRADAVLAPIGVAEGYSVPAWIVTFHDVTYTRNAGCPSAGTLNSFVVSVTAASGRVVSFTSPPAGCHVEHDVSTIAPPYAGRPYADPAGWTIEVPFGWRTSRVDIEEGGVSVHGIQIWNGNITGVPVGKKPGSSAQSGAAATWSVGVIIATDDDQRLKHVPMLVPPLQLDDFAQGSATAQQPSLAVAWTRSSTSDIGITVNIGAYALPDDLMIVQAMLATLQAT